MLFWMDFNTFECLYWKCSTLFVEPQTVHFDNCKVQTPCFVPPPGIEKIDSELHLLGKCALGGRSAYKTKLQSFVVIVLKYQHN